MIDKRTHFESGKIIPMCISYNSYDDLVNEILDTVIDLFNSLENTNHTLTYIADELNISCLKARKLLITAGKRDRKTYYSTDVSDKILELSENGLPVKQIAEQLNLSHASVIGYLPYSKQVYGLKEISADAERVRRYRQREAACRNYMRAVAGMNKAAEEAFLWKMLTCLSGCAFYTLKGLKFTYLIRTDPNGKPCGEMIIDRKKKSITKSSVMIAYWKARNLKGAVKGPKALGTFGASYLYSIFERLGIIGNQAGNSGSTV